MSELKDMHCTQPTNQTKPLKGEELITLQNKLQGEWSIVEGHHLKKEFKFEDFKSALAFTNEVGELAEQESHHPDIYLAWGKVGIEIWTHSIGGLAESDFILAAKIDALT